MPPALSSPGFLVALAVLLANDLWWKAAYGNWLTGKLSDFAGLFVVVVLATAFRPAQASAIALATALAFALWKSPAAQPLIDGWNALAPYRIARVVDYTDLLALAAIQPASRYASRARPLAPAALGYPIVVLALLAILGTSKAPPRWYMDQKEAPENFSFFSGPVRWTVAGTRRDVLEAFQRSGFRVATTWRSDDVDLVSDVACPQRSPERPRLVHAFISVSRADDGGATVALHRVDLCRRDGWWDRDSAAAAFQAEVLEHSQLRWSAAP
jgi:hypothetical protein